MSRKELWSGRFSEGADSFLREFGSSPEDAALLKYDIAGSVAHARMLKACGIIDSNDCSRIEEGLLSIYNTFASKPERLLRNEEDIHMAVERRLTAAIGEAGERLHTGRSRNDQVAADLRMYAREMLLLIHSELTKLARALLKMGEAHADTPLPSYTHLQRAQPIYISHHLMAHFWRLTRDVELLKHAFSVSNVSPLGAAAAAGTSHPIRPEITARLLGFECVFRNSLDASCDRDFLLHSMFAHTCIASHLSSIAEEIVLWSTSEFSFISLPDSLTTGSSIMPHKKNPDMAELVRGKSASVISRLMGAVSISRALPLGYSRDLQVGKGLLMENSLDILQMICATRLMVESMHFNTKATREAASDPFTSSVEIVDELVRRGVPFRQAHSTVGRIVRESVEEGSDFLQLAARKLDIEITPQRSTELRASPGGSSLRSVRAQLSEGAQVLKECKLWEEKARRKCSRVESLLHVTGKDRASRARA